MLIDTHCHIYLKEFDEDRSEMLARAENEGVGFFLLPAIDSHTHPSMLKTVEKYPGKCKAMMGLHPCSVKDNYPHEMLIVEEEITKGQYIAVGEIGLDFYWDKTFLKEQYRVFEMQIEMALQQHLPVVIHSRNSIDECITTIKKYQQRNLKGVFHCFSGSVDQARQIIELGFYLGIGGVVTFKNAGVDKTVEAIDLKHIVLETDAPYLAPVPFRGKRNECSYLKYIVEKICRIKNLPEKVIEEITTRNAKELFNI